MSNFQLQLTVALRSR
ncbi:hypothetical protein CISIN_1g0375442mg, partial [Citrus sinensis]